MSQDPKHELLQELKRLASELGRTPSRREFDGLSQVSRYQIDKHFGGYGPLVQAAGLDPATSSPKKPKLKAADIFGRDVREVLGCGHGSKAQEKLNSDKPRSSNKRILAIGDTHFPFVSHEVLMSIYAFIDSLPEDRKPTHIIQLGDLHDQLSASKFPRSRNIYNPFEEINLAFEMASEMWKTLRRLAPQSECHQILGNHDVRPLKRIIEAYPDGEPFFSIEKYYKFEGVQTHMDPRTPLVLGDYVFTHGHRSRSVDHWNDLPGKNIIHGHSHAGGISYRRFGTETKFIVDAGFAGDPFSKVFGYMPLNVLKFVTAFVWIEDGTPSLRLV